MSRRVLKDVEATLKQKSHKHGLLIDTQKFMDLPFIYCSMQVLHNTAVDFLTRLNPEAFTRVQSQMCKKAHENLPS